MDWHHAETSRKFWAKSWSCYLSNYTTLPQSQQRSTPLCSQFTCLYVQALSAPCWCFKLLRWRRQCMSLLNIETGCPETLKTWSSLLSPRDPENLGHPSGRLKLQQYDLAAAVDIILECAYWYTIQQYALIGWSPVLSPVSATLSISFVFQSVQADCNSKEEEIHCVNIAKPKCYKCPSLNAFPSIRRPESKFPQACNDRGSRADSTYTSK